MTAEAILKVDPKTVRAINPEIDLVYDNPNDPEAFVFIYNSGQYKGIAFIYTNVNIIPSDIDENMFEVEFSYAIVETPYTEKPPEHFEEQIGDLLVELIQNMIPA